MPVSCPQCGAGLPDGAEVCPDCEGFEGAGPAGPEPGSRSDRLLAALAYFSFLPAIVLLVARPFRSNSFVRFHSWQSVYLTVAAVLAAIITKLIASGVALIPRYGQLLAILAGLIFVLGAAGLWLLLILKALQGVAFRLPLVGKLAASQSGSN